MSNLIVIGGGLAGGLVAYRCARAGHAVSLFERDAVLGGNRTWSFHGPDIDAAAMEWLRPFVVSAWPAQSVRFPALDRRLITPYYSISSARFDQILRETPGITVHLRSEVVACSATRIRLAGGEEREADQVWDSRPEPAAPSALQGYQKFVGLELRLESEHGLRDPILMDATVEQTDGFRFVYVLPLTSRTVLVEDTYYSANPALNRERLRDEIFRYIDRQGWRSAGVVREERGVLPIPLSRRAFATTRENAVGYGAGLFHPTTGYSLPLAVRTAEWIASQSEPFSPSLARGWAAERAAQQRGNRLYCLLNRLLFRAPPEERFRILERFYRLPQGLIERFYARRMTQLDWMRVLLWGKPPMSVSRAASAVFGERIHESGR